MAFRKAPAAEGLDFFNEIDETPTSGWVKLPDQAGTFEADRNHNFKLNTRAWDGKELWLYVIAQDGIENLGFSLQKLKVDESTDIPVLSAPGLRSNTEIVDGLQIGGKDALYIRVNESDPDNITASRAKVNVFDRGQGINLSLSDDDAIGKISITLKDLNDTSETNTPKDVVLNISANSREWNNILTQELLARALYGNTTASYLEDGVYELFIRIDDDEKAKVSIDRNPQEEGDIPVSVGTEKRFYFAVQSQAPELTVDSPGENSMQNTASVWINGTVRSRLKIQKMDITFDPRLSSGGWNQTQTVSLNLFSDAQFTASSAINANNWLNESNLKIENGVYIYYWRTTSQINFNPTGLFSGARPEQITSSRRYNVRAWDGFCAMGTAASTVQVDTTPPVINMTEFNFGRLPNTGGDYIVNGKVPVIISVADDLSGIRKGREEGAGTGTGEEGEEQGGGEEETGEPFYIKWWVAQSAPTWNTPFTAGLGGQFTEADDQGGGIFRLVFNTTKITGGGTYNLYVRAEDNARNQAIQTLQAFTVNQSDDLPVLNVEGIDPKDKMIGSGQTTITGRASDDDGFDPAKTSIPEDASEEVITNFKSYVQIRYGDTFLAKDDDNEEAYEASWTNVTSISVDSGSGDINFSFNFSGIPYFTGSDGEKRYQIRLKDEAVAARSGNPPGKNPDGVTSGADALPAVTRVYPLDGSYYKFDRKTTPPTVFFASHDPTPPLSIHHNYKPDRPVFGTKTQLIAALTGNDSDLPYSRSYVNEMYLASIEIIYNDIPDVSSPPDKFSVSKGIYFDPSATSNTYYLHLPWPSSNHANFAEGNWDSIFDWFDKEESSNNPIFGDGEQSITIRAVDQMGNIADVRWSFYKDTTGPTINYDNVSRTDTMIVSNVDEHGDLFVTGQFNDTYSSIANTFGYKIYKSGTAAPEGWTPGSVTSTPGSTSGTWSATVPKGTGFDDGLYELQIQVKDSSGNTTTVDGEGTNDTPIAFIVDRNAPEMITKAENIVDPIKRIKVIGNNLKDKDNQNIDGYLSKTERVFSATGATDTGPTADNAVFTLSGMVKEHNLNELHAAIHNRSSTVVNVDLIGIDASPVAWSKGGEVTGWFYGRNDTDTADLTASENSIRVRRAVKTQANPPVTGDFGLSATDEVTNLYVWELDVRVKDFSELMYHSTLGNTDDSIDRSITISARDLANRNSDTENWPFNLDSQAPTIIFSNLQSADLVLTDQTITLRGSASDSTNIKSISYKIEKYAWTSTSVNWGEDNIGWTVMTGDANGDYTEYPITGFNSWEQWDITDNTAIPTDGYYRLTIKAADYSLSNVSGGNSQVTGPVKFYVDRAEPAITWMPEPQEYYSWDASNKIELKLFVFDYNTLQTSPSGNLYKSDDLDTPVRSATVAVSNPNVVPSIVVPPAVPATSNVTVTINKGATDLDNGDYTLILSIKDKTGKEATNKQTITFYLDNEDPEIEVSALVNGRTLGANEAIAGRVVFESTFDKPVDPNGSEIRRVAYKVSAVSVTTPATLDDESLLADGWIFNDGGSNDGILKDSRTTDDNSGELMKIDTGLSFASMFLYDTRRFTGAKDADNNNLLGGVTTDSPYTNLTFNGINISTNGITTYGSNEVYPLTIYFLAIDGAGNSTLVTKTYYVYPAGDYPKVSKFITPDQTLNPVNRQLAGIIKIEGEAIDNYRVRQVWFRVLKDGSGTLADGSIPAGYSIAELSIPTWDSRWNSTTTLQDPTGSQKNPDNLTFSYKTSGSTVWETDDGTSNGNPKSSARGWYKANRTNTTDDTPVSWWAQINTDSELDPTGIDPSRNIKIQVLAEDTILDDNSGEYNYSNTYFSVMEEIDATVVNGLPIFDASTEKVLAGDSSSVTDLNDPRWVNVLRTAVKGRAAYTVTVKHDSAVKEIRWTNALSTSTTIVSPTANLLDYTKLGNIDDIGIEVKAEPKFVSAVTNNKTYLIWKVDPALNIVVGGTANNIRFRKFTYSGSDISIANSCLLEADADGNFEWFVTVDIDSGKLGLADNFAGHYEVNLQALDNSQPVALRGQKTAKIPIDHLPPSAEYTHISNIAGERQSFGGTANDSEKTALVNGLSRVVLWFSRRLSPSDAEYDLNNPNKERSFVWNQNNSGGVTWNSHAGTAPAGVVNIDIGTNALTPGVELPLIPVDSLGLNGTAPSNNSCIVIDRLDPRGNVVHHGHNLPMGWTDDPVLGKTWYVLLNSLDMDSGRVTAHFIVYDKAGNATYKNTRLMILNGIPRIDSITLATDIYGDTTLDLQNLPGATTIPNRTYGDGATTATVTSGIGFIQAIRDRFASSDVENIGIKATTDAEKGIKTFTGIYSDTPGTYNVVFDQKDFMVRNNLLAVRVETTTPQTPSTNNQRRYRFEYVANYRLLSGTNALTATSTTASASGIRAGKVYIIDDPGINFPWGVLGARGEPKPGLAFLAIQDGSEQTLTGVSGSPSAWELNGTYYTGNAAEANVLTRTVPTPLQFNNDANDVVYPVPGAETNNGKFAEFVYRSGAFAPGNTSTRTQIRDFVSTSNIDATGRPLPYPATQNRATPADMTAPYDDHSLFIVRVFDGEEAELLGDFALLSIRVNNADHTPSYAQLYDLNPKTEESSNPMSTGTSTNWAGVMGQNRAKGGLQTDSGAKTGHIEPRKNTGLNNIEMGGVAAATYTRPSADAEAFFAYDTVSGKVIVRGYAEDNQQIGQVDLVFTSINETPVVTKTVNLLGPRATVGSGNKYFLILGTGTDTGPTLTSGDVEWTETVDLDRHRVEWTYYWNTENMPYSGTTPGNNYVVGNVTVRAVAHNANTALTTGTANANTYRTSYVVAHNNTTSATPPTSGVSTTWDYFNPSYPSAANPASRGHYQRYNQIRVNLRPYITGISGDRKRSLQGRYMFYQGETGVELTGFNLNVGAAGNTNTAISIPAKANNALGDDTTTAPTITSSAIHSQTFTIPAFNNGATATNAATGNGKITLTVTRGGTAYQVVNTGTERVAANSTSYKVQPWNTQYNGINGTELWDDFTSLYIWRSDSTGTTAGDTTVSTATDQGTFPSTDNKWIVLNPSVSINPLNGVLYESHNENGAVNHPTDGSSRNTGAVRLTTNEGVTIARRLPTAGTGANNGNADPDTREKDSLRTAGRFGDPLIMSDVFYNYNGDAVADNVRTAFAITGRVGSAQHWAAMGGIFVSAPGGTDFNLYNVLNANFYMVESNWYNGSTQNIEARRSTGTITDQFKNPHIVTSGNATTEHIHVSYYDRKDGSIKYRYNLRGAPGEITPLVTVGNAAAETTYSNVANNHNNRSKMWTNLDGGFDWEDFDQTFYAHRTVDYNYNTTTKTNTPTMTWTGNNGNSFVRTVRAVHDTYVTAGTEILVLGTRVVATGTTSTTITAATDGIVSIAQAYRTATATGGNYSVQVQSATTTLYTITPVIPAGARVVGYTGTDTQTQNVAATDTANVTTVNSLPSARDTSNAGEHNAIALTSEGYPVIAYYDESNSRLKLAVSRSEAPVLNTDWAIRDYVIPSTHSASYGTGKYVSIAIDTRDGITKDTIHIAAMNSLNNQLVYIKGKLYPTGGNGNDLNNDDILTVDPNDIQVVDFVDSVGRWSKISLDSDGNPWIAYMDEGEIGTRNGAKVAYKNTTTFNKAWEDLYGNPITGWETMHVPINPQWTVTNPTISTAGENGRLGLECYPTRNYEGNAAAKFWGAALTYMASDRYRIAYYVK